MVQEQYLKPSGKYTRFEADDVAKKEGGRLLKHVELDKYKMEGNSGAFWAKEWAAKGLLIEKARDLVDEKTGVLIEAKDVQKMLELHKAREEKAGGKILMKHLIYLIDPEAFKPDNGLYVFENPSITLVENAVLEYGGKGRAAYPTKIARYETKVILDILPDNQMRWIYFNDGVWPLVRGDRWVDFISDYFHGWRSISGVNHPNHPFRVLVSAADVDKVKLKQNL